VKKNFLLLLILIISLSIFVPSVYSFNNPNVNFLSERDANRIQSFSDEEILIILDFSSSMIKKLNNKSRATHAVYAIHEVLDTLNENSKIGLRVFGPDEQSLHEYASGINSRGDCRATKLAVPISGNNIGNLRRKLSEYTRPFGETPIAYSLMLAIQNDFNNPSSLKHIVLITDGGEGCGGNPCKLIADVMSQRNDIKIDVIAIAGDENNSFMGLSCLSNATGGDFIVVHNSDDLYRKLKSTIVYLPRNAEPKPEISPVNSDVPQNNVVPYNFNTNRINQDTKYSNYLFEFDN